MLNMKQSLQKGLSILLLSILVIQFNAVKSQTLIYSTPYQTTATSPPSWGGTATLVAASGSFSTATLTGWSGTYTSTYFLSSSSTGSSTLTFTNALPLVSNGTDKGTIVINYGHKSISKGFTLYINGTSITSYTVAAALTGYTVTYTIPTSQANITSIQCKGSSTSGLYLFSIQINTYSSCTTPTTTYNVTATNSTVCTGGTTIIGLDGAQNGVTYQLFKNGSAFGGNDSIHAISTSAITFPVVTPSNNDVYTVKTQSGYGYCVAAQAGSTASSQTITVNAQPIAPALSTATPASGSTVCVGDNSGTVTGAAGSGGGVGATDSFQYSIDGGATWNPYINSAAINTVAATYTSVQVQSMRTAGTGNGCTASSWGTISTWTVNCSLPVIINTISATSSKSDAIVAWSTATELNVSRFVIERSIDGSSFSDIGTVNAVGIGANNYQFTDNAPVNGVNYYRLKSIDNNGSFTYSKVVSVSLLTNNQLSVFPNPTTDKITVNGNHIASVQVVDNMGRITIAQTYKDVTNPVLSVSGLPVGVYHLRVQTTDGKISGIGFVKK